MLPTASALDPERPTVIVARPRAARQRRRRRRRACASSRAAPRSSGIGEAGEAEPPRRLPARPAHRLRRGRRAGRRGIATLRGAFRHAASLVAAHERASPTGGARIASSRELTTSASRSRRERDLHTLLEMILTQARRDHDERRRLALPRSSGRRRAAHSERPALQAGAELHAARAAVHRVHRADRSREPRRLRRGDRRAARHRRRLSAARRRHATSRTAASTRSSAIARSRCSCIPMKTHRDEIIGVLQLINRKRDRRRRGSPRAEVVEREVLHVRPAAPSSS